MGELYKRDLSNETPSFSLSIERDVSMRELCLGNMNQENSKKRKFSDEDDFNSSDDEMLCKELDSVECKRQKVNHGEKCFVCQIC